MSKKPRDIGANHITRNDPNDGGCGFCLLNLSLMLTAPAALVALVVKARRSS